MTEKPVALPSQQEQTAVNTDRDLWREPPGDYYANRIFLTEGGGIGMDVGGHCIVLPIKKWFGLAAKPKVALPSSPAPTFQERVDLWLIACFGVERSRDTVERNHRFLEEAIELVQSCGCTQSEAHQLVDYTFGREKGSKVQEAGGVMVTLAALCLAQQIDMNAAGGRELQRAWENIVKIRAKADAKPKHSPLAESVSPAPTPNLDDAWKRYCKINAPVSVENREWEAFKFGWDEAMKIAREMVDGN